MSDLIFRTLEVLEKSKVHYRIARTRSDTIQIDAHFVGARVEIEIFEDGHIEMSKFLGNEDVESGGIEMVKRVIEEFS